MATGRRGGGQHPERPVGRPVGRSRPDRLRAGTGSPTATESSNREVQRRQHPAGGGNAPRLGLRGRRHHLEGRRQAGPGEGGRAHALASPRTATAHGHSSGSTASSSCWTSWSGRVRETGIPASTPTAWAWTPDGKAVVVVGSIRSQNGHGTVAFLDPDDLSTKYRVAGPDTSLVASGIQFSPDGERFATSGSDRVGLWDVDTSESSARSALRVEATQGSPKRLLRCAHRLAGRGGLDLGPAARGCRRGGLPDRRASLTERSGSPTFPNGEPVPVCAS